MKKIVVAKVPESNRKGFFKVLFHNHEMQGCRKNETKQARDATSSQ
jgi:hypothetical protein